MGFIGIQSWFIRKFLTAIKSIMLRILLITNIPTFHYSIIPAPFGNICVTGSSILAKMQIFGHQ
jgi:hypothetical protein